MASSWLTDDAPVASRSTYRSNSPKGFERSTANNRAPPTAFSTASSSSSSSTAANNTNPFDTDDDLPASPAKSSGFGRGSGNSSNSNNLSSNPFRNEQKTVAPPLIERTNSTPNYAPPPPPIAGQGASRMSSSNTNKNNDNVNNNASRNSTSTNGSNSSNFGAANPFKSNTNSNTKAASYDDDIETNQNKYQTSINNKKKRNEYEDIPAASDETDEGAHEYDDSSNQLEELDDTGIDFKQESINNLPKNFKIAKLAMFIINIGLMIMMSSTGALAVQNADNIKDTGVIFIGLYMIFFAFVYSIFEVFVNGFRNQKVAEFYRKNFGFFLGPLGRSLFLIFSGMLSFGISNPYDLAVATGVLVFLWGLFNALVQLKYKEYYLQYKKLVPE